MSIGRTLARESEKEKMTIKSVPVMWETEGRLPENIGDEQFDRMYQASAIGGYTVGQTHLGIRVFPYVEVNGERIYLEGKIYDD